MKIYLNEVVDIHQLALNLTYTESNILYDTIFKLTGDYHQIDNDDLFISEEMFFQLYASIMFQFMTKLIELKSINL